MKKKYKESNGKYKGSLQVLGGLLLSGESLFETLVLNLILMPCDNGSYIGYDTDKIRNIQKPCWESKTSEILEKYLSFEIPDNLASLYTYWSRAIYISPYIFDNYCANDVDLFFEMRAVKLPNSIYNTTEKSTNSFLEPMTIWGKKTSKIKVTEYPKEYLQNESLWRSFGQIIQTNEQRTPFIKTWADNLRRIDDFNIINISVNAVGMKYDKKGSIPLEEIFDSLPINYDVFTDNLEGGWNFRINDAVKKTKEIIDFVYGNYVGDIEKIRQFYIEKKRKIKEETFKMQRIEEMYFIIDKLFRNWLLSLKPNDDKDEKVNEWYEVLRCNIEKQAKSLLLKGNNRDYTGIFDGKFGTKNIATAYNKFIKHLNDKLPRKGENYG